MSGQRVVGRTGGRHGQSAFVRGRLAGCSWPYRAARATLKRLGGAEISAEEIRLLLTRQGKLRAAHQQAEAAQVCTAPTQAPTPAEQAEQPVLVGVDGGWVGSREQRGGMEALVSAQCHGHGGFAHRPAQRGLDSTSAVAHFSLTQPWVLVRTEITPEIVSDHSLLFSEAERH